MKHRWLDLRLPLPAPLADEEKDAKPAMRRSVRSLMLFFLLVVVPSLAIMGLGTLLLSDPPAEDLESRLLAARHTGHTGEVLRVLAYRIRREPLRVSHHFEWIQAHRQGSRRSLGNLPTHERLCREYEARAAARDPRMSDLGHLGVAFCLQDEGQPRQALQRLARVRNRRLEYLQYVRGLALTDLGRPDEAEQAFQRELALGGYRAGAVRELAHHHYRTGDWAGIRELRDMSELRPHLPRWIVRESLLRDLRLFSYLESALIPRPGVTNPPGALGAVLIAVVWIWFLRRLDIFEPERLRPLLACFLLGALCAELATPLYDLLSLTAGFGFRGTWSGDLLYAVLGIGLVEEGLKLVPLLVLWRWGDVLDESVDYVIYACVGGLGFAFLENLLRFSEDKLYTIHQRGLVTVILHLLGPAMIAYGVVLARYRRFGRTGLNLAFGFALAILFHGLYDFWLVSEAAPVRLSFLSTLLFLLAVLLLSHILSSTLNQSEYFDESALHRLCHLRERLGVALTVIVLFEYGILAWRFGPTLANDRFMSIIGFTWFVVYFLSFRLSFFVLRRGLWPSLRQTDRQARETAFVPD